MGLLKIHLDPLTTTTPILILSVASGHAIQILKRYYEEYNRLCSEGLTPRHANRGAGVESMVRVGPVMITAGLIATLTFFSLTSTGIPMVQHFGVCAGCGVLSTMLLEMSLIPSLRSLLRPPRVREALREQQAGVLGTVTTGDLVVQRQRAHRAEKHETGGEHRRRRRGEGPLGEQPEVDEGVRDPQRVP